jgi:hypothetical protein
MNRYVLRYRGPGRAPVGEVAHIERSLRVVDRAPGMLLVEGTGAGVTRVMAGLDRWVAAEETTIPVPATHPSLHHSV